MYCMSLVYIPKGILERIRRINFRFLWLGDKEKFCIAWVSWRKIAIPKYCGGQGIKNVHQFSKFMVAMCCWRLIAGEGLWTQVVSR